MRHQLTEMKPNPPLLEHMAASMCTFRLVLYRFRVDGLPKMPKPKCWFFVSGKYFKGSNYIGFKDVRLAAPLSSQ